MRGQSLQRIVDLSPAWDRRHPDPNKNYGIHGVELRMVLTGPLGATQFVVYTNWHLPHVMAEQLARHSGSPRDVELFFSPMAADVGYHSPVPLYEGQQSMGSCPYLDGQECYYDGSGLRAKEWFREIFLPLGSDGIWEALEKEYRERFGPINLGAA